MRVTFKETLKKEKNRNHASSHMDGKKKKVRGTRKERQGTGEKPNSLKGKLPRRT